MDHDDDNDMEDSMQDKDIELNQFQEKEDEEDEEPPEPVASPPLLPNEDWSREDEVDFCDIMSEPSEEAEIRVEAVELQLPDEEGDEEDDPTFVECIPMEPGKPASDNNEGMFSGSPENVMAMTDVLSQ